MGTQQKGKTATADTRILVADIKREADQDAIRTAIQPVFEGTEYVPKTVTHIDFVNVTTNIDGSQTVGGDTTPPGQVTGVTVSALSSSSLSINWNDNVEADLNHYNIYRGTSSGFTVTPGVTTPTGTPSASIFTDSGLSASTTYYYKVLAVDNANNLGTISAQASGTTQTPDVTPPAQVTGLAVSTLTGTSLSITWTANTEPDLNHYKLYRGTSSGFAVTVGVTTPIATPTTNSYTDTGLAASTTYYYKCVATDNSGNNGTISAQASGTTSMAVIPTLELQLNNNFIDAASALTPSTSQNGNGFLAGGNYGSHRWHCNEPAAPATSDNITFADTTVLDMDTTIGFSVAFWINATDISALSRKRTIIEKREDSSNMFTIQIDSSGILYFFVKKAGTDYKRQYSGFVTGANYNIVCVFNGATNTVDIYRNTGSSGASSAATPDYRSTADNSLSIGYSIGNGLNGHYEGMLDEIKYFKGVVLVNPTHVRNLYEGNRAEYLDPLPLPPILTAVENNLGAPQTQQNIYFDPAPTATPANYNYNLQRGDNASFTGSVTTYRLSAYTTPQSYGIISLTAGTTYYYRMSAVNANGNSAWSTVLSQTTSV